MTMGVEIMRHALVARRSGEVIDAECRVIDAEFTMLEEPVRRVSLRVLAPFGLAMVAAGGVPLGLWVGDDAFGALVALAAVTVCIASSHGQRRVSSIYRAGFVLGLVGLGLMSLSPIGWLMALGGALCLVARLALFVFDRKGWRYEN